MSVCVCFPLLCLSLSLCVCVCVCMRVFPSHRLSLLNKPVCAVSYSIVSDSPRTSSRHHSQQLSRATSSRPLPSPQRITDIYIPSSVQTHTHTHTHTCLKRFHHSLTPTPFRNQERERERERRVTHIHRPHTHSPQNKARYLG
ncbi:hypothetical protein GGS21DRAFT_518193 [Xylaria nigripes]|nr:hypothetical protein GGS21DRAFT_518193 [Xylaria nigripes]